MREYLLSGYRADVVCEISNLRNGHIAALIVAMYCYCLRVVLRDMRLLGWQSASFNLQEIDRSIDQSMEICVSMIDTSMLMQAGREYRSVPRNAIHLPERFP